MATSDTGICNIALRMLREQPITGLNDTANRAQMLNTIYADARDFCLAMHPWNFATRRKTLAQNLTPPDFGFQYAYALPASPYCLRVMTVNEGRTPTFKVEGRDLLTDDAAVDLLYIARITDVSTYSPGFVQMFATYLAQMIAYPLTGNQSRSDTLFEAWERMAGKARMLDGIEDVQDDAVVSPFVAIRS